MRTIKFRAWDKQTEKMFIVIEARLSNQGIQRVKIIGKVFHKNSSYSVPTDTIHLPSFELMQFTGLSDKNGKEIYEGDIMSYTNKTAGAQLVDKIVAWNKHRNGWNFTGPYQEKMFWEVIGNVYENPDLLQETSQAA